MLFLKSCPWKPLIWDLHENRSHCLHGQFVVILWWWINMNVNTWVLCFLSETMSTHREVYAITSPKRILQYISPKATHDAIGHMQDPCGDILRRVKILELCWDSFWQDHVLIYCTYWAWVVNPSLLFTDLLFLVLLLVCTMAAKSNSYTSFWVLNERVCFGFSWKAFSILLESMSAGLSKATWGHMRNIASLGAWNVMLVANIWLVAT